MWVLQAMLGLGISAADLHRANIAIPIEKTAFEKVQISPLDHQVGLELSQGVSAQERYTIEQPIWRGFGGVKCCCRAQELLE